MDTFAHSGAFVSPHQQAIRQMVDSLAMILSDRQPGLMDELKERVNGLGSHEIRSFVEHMVVGALANRKGCSCT